MNELSFVSKLHGLSCTSSQLPRRSAFWMKMKKVLFVNSLNCSVPAVSSISKTTCLPLIMVSRLMSDGIKNKTIHPLQASSGMNPQSWGRNSLSRYFGRIVLLNDSVRCLGIKQFHIPVRQLLPTPPTTRSLVSICATRKPFGHHTRS